MLVTLFDRQRAALEPAPPAKRSIWGLADPMAWTRSPFRRPSGLERGDLVDVRLRDGEVLTELEGWGLDWTPCAGATDIVAWRRSFRLVGMGGLVDG